MPHLQLKDIPADVHESLRRRSRSEGISMREYVLRLVEADLGRRDTRAEMVERLATLPRAAAGEKDAAELVRGGRAERERQLEAALGPDE